MAFMDVQAMHDEWLQVDGPCGVDVIPVRSLGIDVPRVFAEWNTAEPIGSDTSLRPVPACIADYCENRSAWELDGPREGYCGRYSAPGYMDCTEWCGPFDSREDAIREAREMYGEDDEDDNNDEDGE